MCIFREFNKLILPGIKFSVLIRNMAPPPKVSGVGGGGICPKCPILDPPLVYVHEGSIMDTSPNLIMRVQGYTMHVHALMRFLCYGCGLCTYTIAIVVKHASMSLC